MIYIHQYGIHNRRPQGGKACDLKTELQTLTGKHHRRSDRFIRLALLGAHKAVKSQKLPPATALYLTSGQGDIPVFQRVRRQRYFDKMMSKPLDFVNLANNSAGFYIAAQLGLDGANLFLSNHGFAATMALLLAQSQLELQKEEAILIGGIDEWLPEQSLSHKLLGVDDSVELGEGSNWMLLKAKADNAMARLSVSPEILDFAGLQSLLADHSPDTQDTQLAFSKRLPKAQIEQLTGGHHRRRFHYENSCAYYETLPFYTVNHFLQRASGNLLYIDSDLKNRQFMTLKLQTQAQPARH